MRTPFYTRNVGSTENKIHEPKMCPPSLLITKPKLNKRRGSVGIKQNIRILLGTWQLQRPR
jgi:hypothetical protein